MKPTLTPMLTPVLASTNEVPVLQDARVDAKNAVAGGSGAPAAAQSDIMALKRIVCTFLLWQDQAYASNAQVKNQIRDLIKKCYPEDVAKLALHVRVEQNIRHTPLFMLACLVRRPEARQIVGEYLPKVIQRADEITTFLEMYWENGRVPIAAQVKKGLGKAFDKFGVYAFGKYKEENAANEGKLSLRDVMHLVHAKPFNPERKEKWTKDYKLSRDSLPENPSRKEILYSQLSNQTVPSPETREVLLSRCSTVQEKRKVYETLIKEGKLGTQALLMNLVGMLELGIDRNVIANAILAANPEKLIPTQFLRSALMAPMFQAEIEKLMLSSLQKFTRLHGKTILVVDCSGSMGQLIDDTRYHRTYKGKPSSAVTFRRQQVANLLAAMALEVCDDVEIYLTAGDDYRRGHKTELLKKSARGFELDRQINSQSRVLGGGGIFTRQALEFIRSETTGTPERIIVISDSQDCDRINPIPKPFGKYNYIVDVSSHKYGINYAGVWTQEISGWSPYFLEYIAQSEKLQSDLF